MGVPVYAQGELDKDGERVEDETSVRPCWRVELDQTNDAVIASEEALLGLEVHVGNTGKQAFAPDDIAACTSQILLPLLQ